MKRTRSTIIMCAIVAVAASWTCWEMQVNAKPLTIVGVSGPDVIVGHIPSATRWGTTNGETSYSIGTTSCNIGDEVFDWIASTNVHPVISQNLYRVADGRIEQLGQSWLKHGFAVAAGNFCGQCTIPAGNALHPGCSDPYGSGLNGNQSLLGPKSQVNASTGFFPYPHTDLPQSGTLDGRIRVPNVDIEPASNPGARYFVESEYIHPQDSAAGNSANNASYREVSFSGNNLNMNMVGATRQQQPAINAWQQVHDDVRLFNVDIPGDGRVVVGVRVTPNGSGGFRTDVAIENLTSHRSVRSMALTFGNDQNSTPGFNDVDYQFEQYTDSDWTPTLNGNTVEWATGTNVNTANAIRWNTLYSFWCDSETCPEEISLGMLRPGTPTNIAVEIPAIESPATGMNVFRGVQLGGALADISQSDDSYVRFNPGFTLNGSEAPISLIFDASLQGGTSCLNFAVESNANTPGLTSTTEAFNWNTNVFDVIGTAAESFNTDTVTNSDLAGSIDDHVSPNGNVLARVGWRQTGFTLIFPWEVRVDSVMWTSR